MKLTAEELGKEWLADKKGTEKKYAKALLEITGTVSSFSINAAHRDPITFVSCGNKGPNDPLWLAIITKQKEPWALAGIGQQITARGKFQNDSIGAIISLSLRDAVLVALARRQPPRSVLPTSERKPRRMRRLPPRNTRAKA